MNTPIVILVFNRPELTLKVFDRIRQVKPKKLLVVADGPRPEKDGELKKCQLTRSITEVIDWDCEVLRNYSDLNLGCGQRVSSGISWAFTHVDRAIILEDDCVPNICFFRFCEDLLEKYKNDARITMISGMNYDAEIYSSVQSYYFSCLPGIWGWATWKRAWDFYDYEMKIFPEVSSFNYLDHIFSDIKHQKHWHDIFKKMYESNDKITWDYQWIFSQWINDGLAVVPHVNLVTNIGHGPEATHTKRKSKISNLPTSEMIFPLTHPPVKSRNLRMDDLIQRKVISKSRYYQFFKKIINYIKSLK